VHTALVGACFPQEAPGPIRPQSYGWSEVCSIFDVSVMATIARPQSAAMQVQHCTMQRWSSPGASHAAATGLIQARGGCHDSAGGWGTCRQVAYPSQG
jgi:hypothetical protein